jgi:methylmalonyl-CoA mutase
MDLDPYNWEIIVNWQEKIAKYKNPIYSFKVRDKEIKIATHTESLSHTQIAKVSLPKYHGGRYPALEFAGERTGGISVCFGIVSV